MKQRLAVATTLSDADLVRRVQALAGNERAATVELIAHLAEFDRRRLHRAEGFGSLFRYCLKVLRLSEQAAYRRIVAARSSRRFPVLLERLESGALSLTTLCVVAPHLTRENHEAVLREAHGRCKREALALVARLFPQPDIRPSVRKLPSANLAAQPVGSAPTLDRMPTTTESPTASTTHAVETQRPTYTAPVVPLAPERYRVQFTIGRETHERLLEAQGLLRREIPDGDLAAVFDRALTLLLQDVARKKIGATMKPRPGHRAGLRSRHLPAAVKRAVWLRDSGRCAFVARSGRRCAERTLLEFHHLDAFALGGETTVDNLALRCREHNAYESELLFGPFPRLVREPAAQYHTGVRPKPTPQPLGLNSVRAECC